MLIRNATPSDLHALAQIWYESWRDAHAALVPPDLVRIRTLQSGEARLRDTLHDVRVLARDERLGGFYLVKHDELDQLFVAAEFRGTGAAALLMADAEERLAAAGVAVARLDCVVGNARAARFYEKCGWQRQGIVENQIDTGEGVFTIPAWRYVKTLANRV